MFCPAKSTKTLRLVNWLLINNLMPIHIFTCGQMFLKNVEVAFKMNLLIILKRRLKYFN